MVNWILGTILAIGYVVMYWFLGALLPEKYQSRSIPVMCLSGFLIYHPTTFRLLWFLIRSQLILLGSPYMSIVIFSFTAFKMFSLSFCTFRAQQGLSFPDFVTSFGLQYKEVSFKGRLYMFLLCFKNIYNCNLFLYIFAFSLTFSQPWHSTVPVCGGAT